MGALSSLFGFAVCLNRNRVHDTDGGWQHHARLAPVAGCGPQVYVASAVAVRQSVRQFKRKPARRQAAKVVRAEGGASCAGRRGIQGQPPAAAAHSPHVELLAGVKSWVATSHVEHSAVGPYATVTLSQPAAARKPETRKEGLSRSGSTPGRAGSPFHALPSAGGCAHLHVQRSRAGRAAPGEALLQARLHAAPPAACSSPRQGSPAASSGGSCTASCLPSGRLSGVSGVSGMSGNGPQLLAMLELQRGGDGARREAGISGAAVTLRSAVHAQPQPHGCTDIQTQRNLSRACSGMRAALTRQS